MALRVRFSAKRNRRPLISALLSSLFAALLCASLSGAHAQIPTPPPVFRTIDDNGVDVTRGTFTFAIDGVSIGQPGAGGLVFTRTWVGSQFGWRHNYEGFASGGPAAGTVYISIGAATETFTYNSGTGNYDPDQRQGSTLTYNSGVFTLTTADGAVALFETSHGRITQLTLPNQERLTFHYIDVTVQGTPFRRLQSVTNNLGYQLHFEYELNNPTTIGQIAAWTALTKVTAINNAVDYCNPTATTCTGLSVTWPSTSFSRNGNYETITDALGRAIRITYGGTGIAAIRRPSSTTTDHITIVYSGSQISAVRRWRSATEYDAWSYGYSDSGDQRTTTVTDPLGHSTTYVSNNVTGILVRVQDALGRNTVNFHDEYGRRTALVMPEGNSTAWTYDDRGNVTQARQVAKPGSGLADIITSASYPATCANPVTCNQPEWTTDARGFRTDYAYDPTHGGILTITPPAPSGAAPVGSGTRPQTRFAYQPLYAYYKNSSSVIVAAPTPVYRLTQTSACATSSWTGSACAAGAADETRTTTAYGSNGVANNRLPVSSTVAAGNGAVSATTSMTYDNVRNLLTVDGPLSGAADTTRFRYDAARQIVGVIGPDPDGGGVLKHRATRTTYNADGQPTIIEQGTVNSQSDPDWNNFAALERTEASYDFAGRPVRSSLIAQSQTHAVAQMSYDAASRLDCVALRMNPVVFGSLPSSACTLSTPGPQGADRITRYAYNSANQQTKVTEGYGTASAIDYWTATYTNNGFINTLADAGGNLTTYAYDGFDRLYRLRYPNATSSGSSTTDYDQYTYNIPANTITWRRRSNDTIISTYDNLGRLTLGDAPGTALDVTATYDLFSRLLTQSTPGHMLIFAYDQLARLTSAQSPLGTVSYQYDAASRRTQITWPDPPPNTFYVQYEYDLTGAVIAVRENGATTGPGVLATYTYDDLGRRTSLTRGNNTTTTYVYDAASRLAELVNTLVGTTQTLEFGYNAIGQVTSRGNSNAAFEWTPPTPGTVNYADNNLNQYTSVGGTNFSYDTRGNLTSNGSQTFSYDVFNRLTNVSGAGSMALSYDPANRLYQTVASGTTTRFLYDGVTLVGEYNSSNSLVRRYVHGAATDEPLVWYEGGGTSDRRWLVADQLGSIIAVTNGSGNVTATPRYGEYGQPNAWTGSRFGYTGQVSLPEAQLYHYRARVYDPQLGRFLQTDPIQFGGGMNIYAYVGNDPINWIDPLGLCTGTRIPTSDCEGIAGFSSGGLGHATGGGGGRFQEDEIVVVGQRIRFPAGGTGISDLIGPARLTDSVFGDLGIGATEEELIVTANMTLRQRQYWFNSIVSGHHSRVLWGEASSAYITYVVLPAAGGVVLLAGAEVVASGLALRAALPAGSALKADVFHRAASWMRPVAALFGRHFKIRGGDGTTVTLTQIRGELNGVPGRFEYIVDQSGRLVHQMFVRGGTINGIPIVP